MLFTDKNMVICGFPGIGKSMEEEKRKDTMDLESSSFKWVPADELNPTHVSSFWPGNYLNEIEARYKDSYRKIILVSTHPNVIRGLQERKIPFLIVAPRTGVEMKNEYMVRFLRRGSSVKFIREMYDCWFRYMRELEEHGEPIIRLGSGQYLTDILPY